MAVGAGADAFGGFGMTCTWHTENSPVVIHRLRDDHGRLLDAFLSAFDLWKWKNRWSEASLRDAA